MEEGAMWEVLEKCGSTERMSTYLAKSGNDELAARFFYLANLKISESLMPLISVLEVTLRNCVHNTLMHKYQRGDWWNADVLNKQEFEESRDKIDRAQKKIYKRTQELSRVQQVKVAQIVAEVSLNFWTDLFSASLAHLLWQDLLDGIKNFPLDKERRKRKTIGKPLNQIKILRNRVMHHEPILFQGAIPSPHLIYASNIEVLSWLSPEIKQWLAKIDRFPEVWKEYDLVRIEFQKWQALKEEIKEARDQIKATNGNMSELRKYYLSAEEQEKVFKDAAKKYLKD